MPEVATRRWLGPALAGLVLSTGAGADPTPERARELVYLLRHDCGSCHGMTLRGGLGPALDPDSLAAKPEDFLTAAILDGRPGTPMPPWRPMLSEAEARWLAAYLKRGGGR